MSGNTSMLWTKLKDIPELVYRTHRILFERQTQSLVIVPRLVAFDSQKDVIYKYLFSQNLWQKYTIERPSCAYRIQSAGVVTKNKIYSYSDNKELIRFELINRVKKCNMEILDSNCIYEFNDNGASVMIEDEFHFIADKHIKYNVNTKKYEFVPSAPMFEIINVNSLIRIKDKLILFGSGMHYRNIFEYDIKKNLWRCLSNLLPIRVCAVSCTPILNGQMILISGDDGTGIKFRVNRLYIYDPKKQILKKVNIKLPLNGNKIFAMNDQKKDLSVTYGWIRNQCENLNLNVPECLILLIKAYYVNEFMHTINVGGEHYRIDVSQILTHC